MFIETNNRYIYIKKENELNTAQHLHNEAEIFICTEGNIKVIHRDNIYLLNPGELMVSFPYDIHGYINSHHGKGFLLIFDPDISSEIKNIIQSGKWGSFIIIPELIPLFEKLSEEYYTDKSTTVMIGYLHLIIGMLIKKLHVQKTDVTPDPELITKALIYVSENYTNQISLASLSKLMGVSHHHMSRVFSGKIPCGFCRYLQKLRVHHACRLLKNTNKTIYEILLESGFTNIQTFYRVFKTETGITPKEYKNSFIHFTE